MTRARGRLEERRDLLARCMARARSLVHRPGSALVAAAAGRDRAFMRRALLGPMATSVRACARRGGASGHGTSSSNGKLPGAPDVAIGAQCGASPNARTLPSGPALPRRYPGTPAPSPYQPPRTDATTRHSDVGTQRCMRMDIAENLLVTKSTDVPLRRARRASGRPLKTNTREALRSACVRACLLV
jgi:hypothetical protein